MWKRISTKSFFCKFFVLYIFLFNDQNSIHKSNKSEKQVLFISTLKTQYSISMMMKSSIISVEREAPQQVLCVTVLLSTISTVSVDGGAVTLGWCREPINPLSLPSFTITIINQSCEPVVTTTTTRSYFVHVIAGFFQYKLWLQQRNVFFKLIIPLISSFALYNIRKHWNIFFPDLKVTP